MTYSKAIIAGLLTFAALPAVSAEAAPHWSSPEQLIAGPADPNEYLRAPPPQTLASPSGAAFGFAGDATNPFALVGTVAGGVSAAPITTSSTGSARGAVGADGTRAAVWGANVAVAPRAAASAHR